MTNIISVGNNGQDITKTNYWDSKHAKRGLVYLTWNAGAARLLVPDPVIPQLNEMLTAKHVVISRGPWPSQNRQDALELLFEDFTDSPFSIHIETGQTDRLLPLREHGTLFDFAIWSRNGLVTKLRGGYRIVPFLPWLKPWEKQGL